MTPAPATADDVYTGYVPPDAAGLARDADAVARDLGPRYELGRFVARGGFASVWAATDRTSGQELAVKRLDPRLGRRRDFYREMRAMFVVEHPNVVRIVNVLEADGTRYLMLELCKGGALRAALSKARRNRRPADPRAARMIVGQIAAGLAALHARGFTHRDLKPENVLFADQVPDPLATGGAVKLADFGLTDLLAAESGALRALTGSPAYMAPEQFSGAPVPASDVYALGVVALELLTGDVPFMGSAEELAVHHIRTPAPIPTGLPTVWAELLPTMLAKQPADRPTAQHVAGLLGWGERRDTPKESRAVNPNTAADEKAGLAREARKATSALSELSAFARPRGRRTEAAPEPPAVAEPPTAFFDSFESGPAVAPKSNDDWFGEEAFAPAEEDAPAEAPFAEDVVEEEPRRDELPTDEAFVPSAGGPQDTLSVQAEGGAQNTPADGYSNPTPDPNGIDDVLDSFNW